jgi:hypothetical protein
MKTVFVGLLALVASTGSIAQASSIDTSCSDASQSFHFSGHGGGTDAVSIRIDHEGRKVDLSTYEDQISLEFKTLATLPDERGNRWFARVSVEQITIRPVGKTVLPDAYSRLKNADGSLTETVICKTSFVSSPIFKK